MNVKELSKEQLFELKQSYLASKTPGGISYGELAQADSLVSNEEIFNEYVDVTFTEDDFFCDEE